MGVRQCTLGYGMYRTLAFNTCDISPRSRNEGMEMGLASSLLPTLSDLLAKLFPPIPMILGSVDLKVFVPNGGMLLLSDTTMILLN